MSAQETLKRFNLKKVVIGRGHDGMGLIADVYLDKTKVAEFLDDGWGGEPDIRFLSNKLENEVKALLVKANVAKYMFEHGWNFMETPDKLSFHDQFGYAVDEAANRIESDKFAKKIEKACLGGIVFGTEKQFTTTTWKNYKTLEALAAHPQGKMAIQQAVMNAKKKLVEGQRILNKPEQLLKFGVTL